MGLNRVAVGDVSRTMTQGSSCLATLGSGTESRWDSRTERDSAARQLSRSRKIVLVIGRWLWISKNLLPPQHGSPSRSTLEPSAAVWVADPRSEQSQSGLGPPAQGWRATPTLGARSEIESTPTALWLRSGARAGTDGPQPRCGWGCFSDDDPG